MPSSGLENPARDPSPALSHSTEFTPLALSKVEGSEAEGNALEGRPRGFCGSEKAPFLIATRAYSRAELTGCKHRVVDFPNRHKIHFLLLLHPGGDGVGTRMPSDECRAPGKFLPHLALPKLNANRGTKLLAIALTRWKQRATTLSNRGKIHFVKSASGCAHLMRPIRRSRG
jgi:hypothetical protein